jgi:hypothetical protein
MKNNMKNNMKSLFFKLGVVIPLIPMILIFIPIKFILVMVGLYLLFDRLDTFFNKKIKNRGLFEAISKMLLYLLCIIIAYCLETFLIGDLITLISPSQPHLFSELVALTLYGFELVSIGKKIRIIR